MLRVACTATGAPIPFSVLLSSTQLWFARELYEARLASFEVRQAQEPRLENEGRVCVCIRLDYTFEQGAHTNFAAIATCSLLGVLFFFLNAKGKGMERNGLMGPMNRSSLRFGDKTWTLRCEACLSWQRMYLGGGAKTALPLGGLLQLITRWLIRGTPLSFPTSELALPIA